MLTKMSLVRRKPLELAMLTSLTTMKTMTSSKRLKYFQLQPTTRQPRQMKTQIS